LIVIGIASLFAAGVQPFILSHDGYNHDVYNHAFVITRSSYTFSSLRKAPPEFLYSGQDPRLDGRQMLDMLSLTRQTQKACLADMFHPK